MTRTAALTGASGFIGSALAPGLAGRGPLRGLFRTPGPEARAWREARDRTVVAGDLADDGALAALVEGADVVYHLAARRGTDDPAESRRVNVEGTRRLARAAGAAGVGRLVYVGTISVYAATEPTDPGATEGEGPDPAGVQTITEEVEPRNPGQLNAYGATKLAGERAAREAAEAGEGPPVTVVRPTNVYGPGGRAWVADWLERMDRVPVALGRGLPLDVVHRDDVAVGLLRAGEAPEAAGETLHLGHHSVEMAEYLAGLARAAGLDPWRLPAWLDRAAREVATRVHRATHQGRMSTPLTRKVRFPHERARRRVGYEPAIPLREGLRGAAAWWRERAGSAGGAAGARAPAGDLRRTGGEPGRPGGHPRGRG